MRRPAVRCGGCGRGGATELSAATWTVAEDIAFLGALSRLGSSPRCGEPNPANPPLDTRLKTAREMREIIPGMISLHFFQRSQPCM